jgi:hypothetical protein
MDGRVTLRSAVKSQLQTLKSETAFYYGEVVEIKGVKFTITRMNNSTLCVHPINKFRHFAGILLVEESEHVTTGVADSEGTGAPESSSTPVGRDGQHDVPVPSNP